MTESKIFDIHASQYDAWFDKNKFAYWSEIQAVEHMMPREFHAGIEVGVGTGRFAKPLGITLGIEPSAAMGEIARSRGITVIDGFAENLPFENDRFDFLLMVTLLCFLDDIPKSLSEAYRVLKSNGYLIIGFIDKNSFLGKKYRKYKKKSLFYRSATFYSSEEVATNLKNAGFIDDTFVQTLFHGLDKVSEVETTKRGQGEGSFVVVRAKKGCMAMGKTG